jgi:hypothetical protein
MFTVFALDDYNSIFLLQVVNTVEEAVDYILAKECADSL